MTGRTEAHRYDESLRSIDLVTKDAYEPTLPLSVVVHIDYQKAPNVIQRFGDVKKLITQTLDPMLSAYFRDVAHKRTMLELLQDRDSIQHESSNELGRKFHNFDIECVDVLIGKPDTRTGRRQDRDAARTVAAAAAFARAGRDLLEAGHRGPEPAHAQRGPGPGADANPAVELAGADQDRRERGRGATGPGSQAGRAGGRHRRGREPAAHPGRSRRRRADLAGRFLRSLGLAPQDPVVLRPAALRPVGRGPGPGQVHPAAGARAGLHLGRSRRQRRCRATGRPAPGALAGNGVFGLAAQHAGGREIRLPARRPARRDPTCTSSPKRSPSRRWRRSSRPSPPTEPRRRSTKATARDGPAPAAIAACRPAT